MSADDAARGQLWHGRFDVSPAEELVAFTGSLDYDQRLLIDDVACSKAHVRGLHRAGLLSEDELGAVLGGLDAVEMEFRSGDLAFVASDEDVHTAIERRVTELVGPAGGKLHTGRSRNDQVATAFRRYVGRELGVVASRVLDLASVLGDRAFEAGTGADAAYLPGYTHLQQAQPVLLAHHLGAHAWALLRDVDRIADCRRRCDVSPLGAGALAGSSLPLDPAATAVDAGFSAVFDNSLDATSDRDFAAETLFVCALLGVHLSRLGEELVVWSTDEFGFVRLDDAYATGSSMLPQKKNPDVAELARGKAGRLIGDLAGFLATLKGLPLAYNRDLQEDKERIFDSIDTLEAVLGVAGPLVAGTSFDRQRIAATIERGHLDATSLMEALIAQGVPQRTAHETVGHLVRRAMTRGVSLAELSDEEFSRDYAGWNGSLRGALGASRAVERMASFGSTGPAAVAEQISAWRRRLGVAVAP